eukprot:359594-Chlamydomonas_euryale.AAC.4
MWGGTHGGEGGGCKGGALGTRACGNGIAPHNARLARKVAEILPKDIAVSVACGSLQLTCATPASASHAVSASALDTVNMLMAMTRMFMHGAPWPCAATP